MKEHEFDTMNCSGCKCDHCARSSELYAGYVTIGEVTDAGQICFACDECKHYDGDYRKRSQYRSECDGYIEPVKYSEAAVADRRRSFRVI